MVGCLGEEDGGRGEGGGEMLCEKNVCIPASGFQASAPTCNYFFGYPLLKRTFVETRQLFVFLLF